MDANLRHGCVPEQRLLRFLQASQLARRRALLLLCPLTKFIEFIEEAGRDAMGRGGSTTGGLSFL